MTETKLTERQQKILNLIEEFPTTQAMPRRTSAYGALNALRTAGSTYALNKTHYRTSYEEKGNLLGLPFFVCLVNPSSTGSVM